MATSRPIRRPVAPTKPARGRPKARLYSIKDLAEYLNCSRTTIYRLLYNGAPHYRVGSDVRFDRAEVLAWCRGRDKLTWQDDA